MKIGEGEDSTGSEPSIDDIDGDDDVDNDGDMEDVQLDDEEDDDDELLDEGENSPHSSSNSTQQPGTNNSRQRQRRKFLKFHNRGGIPSIMRSFLNPTTPNDEPENFASVAKRKVKGWFRGRGRGKEIEEGTVVVPEKGEIPAGPDYEIEADGDLR